jgi:hypothetical protein
VSDERWVKVNSLDAEVGGIEDAYAAAAGQRVESIYWCETHKLPHHRGLGPYSDCRIVEATLILPPQERSA